MTSAPEPPVPDDAAAPSIDRRALATVWLTLFLDLLGFGMVMPLLQYYALHHGATAIHAALLSTTFSAAQFVMSPVLGRISDRYGRRPVMLISIGGSVGAMLLLGFADVLWMVFAARLLSGMCNANISTANAYVADRVPAEQRARYMGMMGSAIGLGFIFGPGIGGLLYTEEFPTLPYFVAAALAAVNWLMAWRWLPESRRPSRRIGRRVGFPLSPAVFRALRGSWLGPVVAVTFCFYFAFANMESTFALYTQARLGFGERETGYFFTYIGAVVAVTQGVLVGRIVGAVGERRTLLLGLIALSLGLATFAASALLPALFVGGLLVSCGNGLITPNINALVSRNSSEDEQGYNLGINASAAALGRIIGPAVAGPLFEHQGSGVPMGVGSAAVIVAWVLGVLLVRQPGPAEERRARGTEAARTDPRGVSVK